ncbi:MAG: bifunctional shikimate kinase/3-dehydroquinate synthase [bacterium]|nr:bifunctional shikimate kinase/3-dehydroquinate synthase [bacterium]
MTDRANLVLVGSRGGRAGAVAREVARATGREVVDLDALFEARTGATPVAYAEAHGEAGAHQVEAEVAREAAQSRGAVVLASPGAVRDPIARWELWHSGPVTWIDDDAAADGGRYSAAADLLVSAEESAPAEAVLAWVEANSEEVPRARTLLDVSVRRDHPMGPRQARILFGSGFDSEALAGLVAMHSHGVPVVVVDENVAELQPGLVGALPDGRRRLIDAGERNKRISAMEAMLEFASDQRAERGDAWVAVGGGTTGDLVGTAAALYMRGAPLIQVPTTWLAMADAAIGGKVAVDLSRAKNSAGAFWPPVAVVGDVATIETLSWERRLDGMAECLKSAIIGDPWLWDLVKRRGVSSMSEGEDADLAARYAIIERTAMQKVSVVERDPFELGERRNLNLGHTIGHALEIESGYALPHGRAVVLGIRAVAHIAAVRGDLARDVADEIDEVIAVLGFGMTRSFDEGAVMAALVGDKKSEAGRIRWILPTGIGSVRQANDVTEDEVRAALEHIREG